MRTSLKVEIRHLSCLNILFDSCIHFCLVTLNHLEILETIFLIFNAFIFPSHALTNLSVSNHSVKLGLTLWCLPMPGVPYPCHYSACSAPELIRLFLSQSELCNHLVRLGIPLFRQVRTLPKVVEPYGPFLIVRNIIFPLLLHLLLQEEDLSGFYLISTLGLGKYNGALCSEDLSSRGNGYSWSPLLMWDNVCTTLCSCFVLWSSPILFLLE